MSAYTAFARVYDSFMDDIPYEKWADNITGYLKKRNLLNCTVLELGCGTGSFTSLMAREGYKMHGIDLSAAMIKMAKKKGCKAKFEVGDMRMLGISDRFMVAVSVCDTMNYLLDELELQEALMSVYRALKPGGIFIFDLKTERFFENLGEEIYTDEKPVGEYVWENYYDKETRDNDYYISFYIKSGRKYRKYVEEHTQHAFRPEEVRKAAKECGFKIIAELDADFNEPADYNGERTYFILERNSENE